MHGQRLIRQRLAYAQVGGDIDQVAVAGRQAEYRLRLQLVHIAAIKR